MGAIYFPRLARIWCEVTIGLAWGPSLDVSKLVRLDIALAKLDERGLSGDVIATDGPFGNLVTDISGDDFLKLGYARGTDRPHHRGRNEMNIPFVRTFSDVPLKNPLLYIDSRGRLGFAVNQGSFAATYGIKPPVAIFIPRAQVVRGESRKRQT